MMLWIADASASGFVGTQMRHSSTLPCSMCCKVRLDSWSAFCYLGWLGLLCHMGEGGECLALASTGRTQTLPDLLSSAGWETEPLWFSGPLFSL